MVFVHINFASYYMARILLHNCFVFKVNNHSYLLVKVLKEHILPHHRENLTIFMANKFNYCYSFGWECMLLLRRQNLRFLCLRVEFFRCMMVRILTLFDHFNINYNDLRVEKKLLER
jgi:hypothetical protein